MRLSRIYTQQPLSVDSTINLETGASHHLQRVMRLGKGDAVLLFNGNGDEYRGRVNKSAKQMISMAIEALLRTEPSPTLKIELLIGISRGERMDYALQKAVELGVTSVHPIFTNRCMVKLEDKRLRQRMGHWRNIIINACEQSGRCRLPDLLEPCTLPQALNILPETTALLLHHLSSQTLLDLEKPKAALTILVGPEGGLSEGERDLAQQYGWTPIRLGPRILRTETAPLAAIAAIQTLWGDFR